MLTLARKDQQRVRIGLPDGREMWVGVDLRGLNSTYPGRPTEIKLSFDAPRDIQVDREEVHILKCQKRSTKNTAT